MIDYKIEKPDLLKISEKRKEFLNLNMFEIFNKNNLIKYSNEKYLFWDKIKFQELPKELENNEELWYIIKSFRF
jgi:hypothetical protein